MHTKIASPIQEADCQTVADSINYVWNPIYIAPTGSRRGRQFTQKEVSANIELHLEQDWYHGKLGAGHGGRHIAEQRVTEYCAKMEAPDGSFLVRESGTYVGDYVLSIWWDGKVQHIRIHWRQDADVHRFFLTDTVVFDSLYDLITHYKEIAKTGISGFLDLCRRRLFSLPAPYPLHLPPFCK
uniref:phosphoinositide phospholipase C n=1 Tax=Gallus gallus TaxID=9031 RepID=A0A8V0X1S7_CHICK